MQHQHTIKLEDLKAVHETVKNPIEIGWIFLLSHSLFLRLRFSVICSVEMQCLGYRYETSWHSTFCTYTQDSYSLLKGFSLFQLFPPSPFSLPLTSYIIFFHILFLSLNFSPWSFGFSLSLLIAGVIFRREFLFLCCFCLYSFLLAWNWTFSFSLTCTLRHYWYSSLGLGFIIWCTELHSSPSRLRFNSPR